MSARAVSNSRRRWHEAVSLLALPFEKGRSGPHLSSRRSGVAHRAGLRRVRTEEQTTAAVRVVRLDGRVPAVGRGSARATRKGDRCRRSPRVRRGRTSRQFRLLASAVALFATLTLGTAWQTLGLAAPQLLGPLPIRRPVDSLQQTKKDAEDAYHQGDYEKAERLANHVLAFDPTDDVALYLRASARVELGRLRRDAKLLRDGIADAREAIRLTKTKVVNYYLPYLYGMVSLAEAENHRPHAETALKVADELLSRSSLTPEEKANVLYQRAGIRAYLKQTDQAIADYREAIRVYPSHMGAYLALGEALQAAGQTNEAQKVFDQAADSFPNSPLVFNNRGMFWQRQNQLEKAVADYTRALQLDPNFAVAYVNRGYCLLLQGQFEAAEADLTSAIRISANMPLAYSLRGTARLSQQKLEQAIDDYQRVVQLDANSTAAHADLGFAYFFAGRYREALKEFETAQRLPPDAKFLSAWRYWALVLDGRRQEAERWWQQQRAARDSGQPETWPERLTDFLAGRISAEQLLQTASEDPKLAPARTCEAHYFIGLKLQHQGRAAEAQDHFRKALQTQQRHLSAYRGARIALASGSGTGS